MGVRVRGRFRVRVSVRVRGVRFRVKVINARVFTVMISQSQG